MIMEKDHLLMDTLSIVSGTEADRETVLENFSEDQRRAVMADIIKKKKDFYIVRNPKTGKQSGYAAVGNNERIENCTEISLKFNDNEITENMIEETLKYLISTISENSSVNNICVKAENNDEKLNNVLSKLGFLKEGIFISNQFVKGEFSFYTVYKYKL